jgi:hypothetical protein
MVPAGQVHSPSLQVARFSTSSQRPLVPPAHSGATPSHWPVPPPGLLPVSPQAARDRSRPVNTAGRSRGFMAARLAPAATGGRRDCLAKSGDRVLAGSRADHHVRVLAFLQKRQPAREGAERAGDAVETRGGKVDRVVPGTAISRGALATVVDRSVPGTAPWSAPAPPAVATGGLGLPVPLGCPGHRVHRSPAASGSRNAGRPRRPARRRRQKPVASVARGHGLPGGQ